MEFLILFRNFLGANYSVSHFIPESEQGSPELYQGITYEKDRNYIEK